MTRNEVKRLAQYHKFTKLELYEILKEALSSLPNEFWKEPSESNPLFDNGWYFNLCRRIIQYTGDNGDEYCEDIVVYRILYVFGQFSKVTLPKKKIHKETNVIIKSEIPTLD